MTGSFSEMLFLFLLALLIFGPRKLPEIARQIGKALAEFRRASNEFKSQLETEMRQIEVEEALRKQPQPAVLPPPEPAPESGNPDALQPSQPMPESGNHDALQPSQPMPESGNHDALQPSQPMPESGNHDALQPSQPMPESGNHDAPSPAAALEGQQVSPSGDLQEIGGNGRS